MKFVCVICHANECREELVEEVFRVDGKYVLVGSIPAVVCSRCGEQSFSRETTEKIRRMVHGQAKARKSVPMKVFDFVSEAV